MTSLPTRASEAAQVVTALYPSRRDARQLAEAKRMYRRFLLLVPCATGGCSLDGLDDEDREEAIEHFRLSEDDVKDWMSGAIELEWFEAVAKFQAMQIPEAVE